MTSIKILGSSHRFLCLAFAGWCVWRTKQTMCCNSWEVKIYRSRV